MVEIESKQLGRQEWDAPQPLRRFQAGVWAE